ncbi:hypothetical protein [Moraxella ovis]|uniref:hypothetical protein n=1 Tax=Moraxella ovis TaxID=29433 RepID=UPI00215D5FE9|nr:hypothetical protein [Moraxella ovis]
MWLHLFEFARMVPVSLSTKKRIDVMSLPIIKGLMLMQNRPRSAAKKDGALFVDAMAKNNKPKTVISMTKCAKIAILSAYRSFYESH